MEANIYDELDAEHCLDAFDGSTFRKQHTLQLIMQVSLSAPAAARSRLRVWRPECNDTTGSQLTANGESPRKGGRDLCARLNQATAEPAVHDLIIVLQHLGILRAARASPESDHVHFAVRIRLGQLRAHITDPKRQGGKARNTILLCTFVI